MILELLLSLYPLSSTIYSFGFQEHPWLEIASQMIFLLSVLCSPNLSCTFTARIPPQELATLLYNTLPRPSYLENVSLAWHTRPSLTWPCPPWHAHLPTGLTWNSALWCSVPATYHLFTAVLFPLLWCPPFQSKESFYIPGVLAPPHLGPPLSLIMFLSPPLEGEHLKGKVGFYSVLALNIQDCVWGTQYYISIR